MIQGLRKITWGETAAILATIVAVVSLIVSVRNCQRSEQSFELNLKEYEETRRLFFIGRIRNSLNLDLIVVNDLAKVDVVVISFPKYFKVDPVSLVHPNLSIKLDKFYASVKILVFGNFRREDDRTISMIGFLRIIPVAIEARYFVKGKMLYHKAIYILDFDYSISSKDVRTGHWKDSEITLRKLTFSYQLNDKDDAKNEVERLWEKISGKNREDESSKVPSN